MAPSDEVTKKIIYQLIVDARDAIANYAAAVRAGGDYQESLKQVDTTLKPLQSSLKEVGSDIDETGEKSKKAKPKVTDFGKVRSSFGGISGASWAFAFNTPPGAVTSKVSRVTPTKIP